MFYIYYSNLLETQKDILLHLIQSKPLVDPLQKEIILVQSHVMEQWLNWQIADATGIAANFTYPMPASFIWQLYVDNLPNVEEQNLFRKESLVWRLMRILPYYLAMPAFRSLDHYLVSSAEMQQQKCYQLAYKIADLFDQYLVYRPQWIQAWEENRDQAIIQEITQKNLNITPELREQIVEDITWQGILWRAVVADIQAESQTDSVHHRASLHLQMLDFLQHNAPKNLPERLFIFGISTLPLVHLAFFQALSQYCDIHLFFTNGCESYWGDLVDPKIWKKGQLRQHLTYLRRENQENFPLKAKPSVKQQDCISNQSLFATRHGEALANGHPLLAAWGKMGRDFLYALTELAAQDHIPVAEIDAYVPSQEPALLNQIQQHILQFTPSAKGCLTLDAQDQSLSIHSCYSPMREIEALQDYLLHLFNSHPEIQPKDVVVMVADIDRYSPYIQAVFGEGKHYIPFAITDKKLTENDIVVASFLQLLQLKNSQFSAEEVLAFLDVPIIRQRFGIVLDDLALLHHWVKTAGIRFGLAKKSTEKVPFSVNYNAWQAGLERILLGYSLREENGIWEDTLALDSSAGLQGQLAGKLVDFIDALWALKQMLAEPQTIAYWHQALTDLITTFFDGEQQNQIWCYLKDVIDNLCENIKRSGFNAPIESEIITQNLQETLQNTPNNYRLSLGKLNFCTLLPMRSIPFKVICLLGMNTSDYPRIQEPTSFDLMQFHHQKGDRCRRDDDRYLFLEALLSAQQFLYLSFVGRSIIDDTPKEPSVLLSQLMDYLQENFSEFVGEKWRQQLFHQHPLNAFSTQNFLGDTPSFARKWLVMAKGENEYESKDFIAPLSAPLAIQTLDLNELIAFVKAPVKYFFEKRLGVYFRQDMTTIDDCENFHLEGLQSYQIQQQLLATPSHQFAQEWQKWKHKGSLPCAKFADLEEQEVRQILKNFREKLACNLPNNEGEIDAGENDWRECDFTELGVKLQDNVANLYENQRRFVRYRLAEVKSEDLLEVWLKTLFLFATDGTYDRLPSLHIGTDKVWCLGEGLTPTLARQQLACYVQDFLIAQQQLCLVPSEKLLDFYNDLASETLLDTLTKVIESLTQNGDSEVAYVYWRRIASQHQFEQSLPEILAYCHTWFDLFAMHAKELARK